MEYKKGSPGEPADENLRRSIMEQTIERYCTVEESVKESFRQVKLMQEGKIPKKSWEDLVGEIEGIRDKEQGSLCSKRKGNKSR